jgi:hypothetical protein
MLVRPATLQDVLHVGETMWERGRKELGALGIGRRAWLEGWQGRINAGDAVAIGEHAILGCNRYKDICDTHFQASESFELPGVGGSVTKAMRKAIPDLMRERGFRVSFTYSLCIDPEAPKWFRLLGLEEDTNFKGKEHGPYVMRRFVRRA